MKLLWLVFTKLNGPLWATTGQTPSNSKYLSYLHTTLLCCNFLVLRIKLSIYLVFQHVPIPAKTSLSQKGYCTVAWMGSQVLLPGFLWAVLGTKKYIKATGDINKTYRRMFTIDQTQKFFHDQACPMMVVKKE